jgi:hypothetical protein
MADTLGAVSAWLDTFSPVQSMAENPEALAKEIETIAAVFIREGGGFGLIDKTFRHIKMTSQSRAWPTAAQVYDSLRAVRSEARGERVTGDNRGDKDLLSGFDRDLLESRILPEAKRWLRVFPGLRHHAIKTLEFWGEPLIDDQGNMHKAGS